MLHLMGSAGGISVRLDRASRVFAGGIKAVDSISCDVPPGEFLAILGPSGCGKSTLLRLIAGLDPCDGGTITIGEGNDRQSIAFVFQDAHLLPWRNAMANVALPLEFAGVARTQRMRIARDALAQVGLADAANRYPAQLSGGMRMRLSLARALVVEPRLLLLDEPFAALDEITRQSLDQQLRDLWTARRMTVIFVTHATAEAAFLAERALVMSPRPASIVEDRRIALPAHRVAETRGTPEFAAETLALYQALRRGGGVA